MSALLASGETGYDKHLLMNSRLSEACELVTILNRQIIE